MFETLLGALGLSAFSLQGFGPLLLEGAWMTVKLSLSSLALSVLLGLIGASAKLSSLRLLRLPAQLYTTLIRGVPDLVLMLLIFYSLQTWLTAITAALALKPSAAKQIATKAKTGPPVVDMNIPAAAINRAAATHACWCFHLADSEAKAYMPTIDSSHGIELNIPTWTSLKSPIFLMMLGSQKVAA